MVESLARNWWALALRGALAVIFAILALFWPEATFASLVLLFGAYALVDGIFTIIAGIRAHGEEDRWWALVLEGLVGIAAGVITFLFPGLAGTALIYLVAAWAIITGILEIAAAIRLRKEIEGEFLLGLGGLLSIVLGVLIMVWPAAGVLAITWMIAGYALFFGIFMIALAFRLRGKRGASGAAVYTNTSKS